jgi:hypothetical protein
MYEYRFEQLKPRQLGFGGFNLDPADIHAVVTELARDGWRLVQVVPTTWTGNGRPKSYEVIFERRIGVD